MDNEDYIFLDYEPKTKIFIVRKGYSHKISGSLKWDGEEDYYTLDEFRKKYPEYINKLEQLIIDIQKEVNK
ncbi:MAG: hypothetical protein N0E44_12660 [Candidatus Thiodiazotropha lotti]|nr:hypothetical protein [Candidatus Thiodiazotropha lotti]MCW4220739.1 hypothetical protein [Candidatus Thiodiazotropha lotti]